MIKMMHREKKVAIPLDATTSTSIVLFCLVDFYVVIRLRKLVLMNEYITLINTNKSH